MGPTPRPRALAIGLSFVQTATSSEKTVTGGQSHEQRNRAARDDR
jgi:hypothetical protein